MIGILALRMSTIVSWQKEVKNGGGLHMLDRQQLVIQSLDC